MKFKGDIVITDPCYVVNDEDWEFSEYGDRMDKLGFTFYLVRPTIIGDWVCNVIEDSGEVLGTFTADAGLVGVFLLDEVLEHNPDFLRYTNPACYTIIRDFVGDILIIEDVGEYSNVFVSGVGNINFQSVFIGF